MPRCACSTPAAAAGAASPPRCVMAMPLCRAAISLAATSPNTAATAGGGYLHAPDFRYWIYTPMYMPRLPGCRQEVSFRKSPVCMHTVPMHAEHAQHLGGSMYLSWERVEIKVQLENRDDLDTCKPKRCLVQSVAPETHQCRQLRSSSRRSTQDCRAPSSAHKASALLSGICSHAHRLSRL